jgi:hypothetical protein
VLVMLLWCWKRPALRALTLFSRQARFPLVDAPLREKVEFDMEVDKRLPANQQALQLIKKLERALPSMTNGSKGLMILKRCF